MSQRVRKPPETKRWDAQLQQERESFSHILKGIFDS